VIRSVTSEQSTLALRYLLEGGTHMIKKAAFGLLLAAFALPFATLPARADEHTFKITNNGGHQVDHIHISPISAEKWGKSITFTIRTDCEMDVLFIYHDGTKVTKKDVDTCKYDYTLDY
jgi:hypothetical protein